MSEFSEESGEYSSEEIEVSDIDDGDCEEENYDEGQPGSVEDNNCQRRLPEEPKVNH